VVAEGFAEGVHEGGFAGADGAADADAEGGLGHFMPFGREGRNFFFEKKKQKTFGPLRGCVARALRFRLECFGKVKALPIRLRAIASQNFENVEGLG